MMKKMIASACAFVVCVAAAWANERLNPERDRRPLEFGFRIVGEEGTRFKKDVDPGLGRATVALSPKSGVWDCSSKLWLVVDVRNHGDTSVLARAGVTSAEKKWGENHGAVRVPPGETRALPVLILRASAEGLDMNELKSVFRDMRGYPGGHQSSSWRRIDASMIKRLRIDVYTTADAVDCEVMNLRGAVDFKPPTLAGMKARHVPSTDAFGQEKHGAWAFKIQTKEDFAQRMASEEAWLAKFTELRDRSRYGGWTGGPRFPATGRFATAEKDGVWWLVDPEGYPFWSMGATGINLKLGNTQTPGVGKWNPRQENLKFKFGEDWRVKSSDLTHRRFKAWGMNTFGNWSDPDVYMEGGTPYTVAVHTRLAPIPEKGDPHKLLPDVFHPDFRGKIFAAVAKNAREAKDPWCVGFFIDNELPFGQAVTPGMKALAAPADCPSKMEFVRQLREKYETIEGLNAAWNSAFAEWGAVSSPAGKWVPARTEDLEAFSERWYRVYFETCRDAMREHAPDTLYLGSRINHTKNKMALSICAEYADVVSINFYDYTPNAFEPPEDFNAPVIIGEFHFGTITERGVWGGGLCTGVDIEHSADLFQNYFAAAVQHPLIVGAHWFKFSDQPLTGRGDGENYRIGFVDVTDTPYPEMVKACRAVSENMYGARAKLSSKGPMR